MNKDNYNLSLKKMWGHFKVINRHRWKVFCLCCKVGIPIQGFFHDCSKYLPVEFFESARYYGEGKYSPIKTCKKEKGYSLGWIHHKNHNKHHLEYWYDYDSPVETPMMPFKYFLELICDSMAAGITYQGKEWTKEYQLTYWNRVKDRIKANPSIKKMIEKVYTDISKEGINPVLKRNRLKELYQKYNEE